MHGPSPTLELTTSTWQYFMRVADVRVHTALQPLCALQSQSSSQGGADFSAEADGSTAVLPRTAVLEDGAGAVADGAEPLAGDSRCWQAPRTNSTPTDTRKLDMRAS